MKNRRFLMEKAEPKLNSSPEESSPSIDLDSSLKKLEQLAFTLLQQRNDLVLRLSKETLKQISLLESPSDYQARLILARYLILVELNNFSLKETCSTLAQILQQLEDFTLHLPQSKISEPRLM